MDMQLFGVDLGNARPNRLVGQHWQGEDDDKVDDATQHHAADEPEQEPDHPQSPRMMAGMDSSLEKPENTAVS
ncbi:hypothetical protein D9M68_954870 [compost metagenome]